jgi:hypothetical protein
VPGIVGDSGEHGDVHRVHEIESNSTTPIALPFVERLGADDGNAQARRLGVPQRGRRRPHLHQRSGAGRGHEDRLGGWPRPEPLGQRQALLFLAGPVSGHEDQRRQGAVGQDQAIGQSGAPGIQDGGDEPVAQRLRARRVLPPAIGTNGQTARQHRHSQQVGANGLLHADPG